MPVFGRFRWLGLGLVGTGFACPCHALLGLIGLATGGALLSPAAQDGVHSIYVPFAILAGALLLKRPARR